MYWQHTPILVKLWNMRKLISRFLDILQFFFPPWMSWPTNPCLSCAQLITPPVQGKLWQHVHSETLGQNNKGTAAGSITLQRAPFPGELLFNERAMRGKCLHDGIWNDGLAWKRPFALQTMPHSWCQVLGLWQYQLNGTEGSASSLEL